MQLNRFFFLGLALLAAVFLLLTAFLRNPTFPEESFSAIFSQSNRLGSFSTQTIAASCGSNSLPVVSLSWSSPGAVAYYSIQRRIVNSYAWTNLGSTAQTYFIDKNWTAASKAGVYEYQVVAINQSRSLITKSANVAVPSCAAPSPQPTNASSSSATILWGAYAGDNTSDATDFETKVGKKMNIGVVFLDLGLDSFPTQFTDVNKTLLIFWEPYSTNLDNLIAGQLDSYIKQFAADAKTYGGPIILAPLAEANGDWVPWGATIGTNSPAKVIAAWKKIHDLFIDASNVKFGWAMNNDSVPDTPANQLENYYPGDSYVDYVGVDGFNFDNPWQSFGEVFNDVLTRLAKYNKPIYIFSFACAPGSQKANWITDALKIQIPRHPQIVGWVWFNENKETDWRVWSDSASLEAFKAALP